MTIKNKQTGTTIVELLVYMALVSVFVTILVEIFVSILKLSLTSQSTSALTADSRFIFSRLSYDLGNASSVSVPVSPGQTAATLQFVRSGNAYTYSLDGDGNLVVTTGGVSAKLNGLDTKLSGISFERIGNAGGKPTLQVIFTIESLITESNSPRSQVFQTTYGLR